MDSFYLGIGKHKEQRNTRVTENTLGLDRNMVPTVPLRNAYHVFRMTLPFAVQLNIVFFKGRQGHIDIRQEQTLTKSVIEKIRNLPLNGMDLYIINFEYMQGFKKQKETVEHDCSVAAIYISLAVTCSKQHFVNGSLTFLILVYKRHKFHAFHVKHYNALLLI